MDKQGDVNLTLAWKVVSRPLPTQRNTLGRMGKNASQPLSEKESISIKLRAHVLHINTCSIDSAV